MSVRIRRPRTFLSLLAILKIAAQRLPLARFRQAIRRKDVIVRCRRGRFVADPASASAAPFISRRPRVRPCRSFLIVSTEASEIMVRILYVELREEARQEGDRALHGGLWGLRPPSPDPTPPPGAGPARTEQGPPSVGVSCVSRSSCCGAAAPDVRTGAPPTNNARHKPAVKSVRFRSKQVFVHLLLGPNRGFSRGWRAFLSSHELPPSYRSLMQVPSGA